MVADAAGVERSTVSYVLSGKGAHIRPEVADRIRRAAARLRYTPNRHARALLTGHTGTVGILLTTPWHFQGWVWSRVALGFQQALFENGYDVLLHGADAARIQDDAEDLLREGRVDGALALGAVRVTRSMRGRRPPLVAVDLGEGHRCPRVHQDPGPGLREAAAHLFTLGHRRIAWLGPELAAGHPSRGREDAVAAFAKEKKLKLDRAVLALRPGAAGNPNPANLAETRTAVLARLGALRDATAVLCWNDQIAACLCEVLRGRGVRVPQDVSVTGFDDLQPYLSRPSLSTVSGAYYEMGVAAARMLLERIGGRATGLALAVPTRFIPRESSGPAPSPREARREPRP